MKITQLEKCIMYFIGLMLLILIMCLTSCAIQIYKAGGIDNLIIEVGKDIKNIVIEITED